MLSAWTNTVWRLCVINAICEMLSVGRNGQKMVVKPPLNISDQRKIVEWRVSEVNIN